SRARTSASVLELLSIVHMVAYHSERQSLHRIKEIRPAYLYQSIPFDVRKNAMLLFMAELCAKTVRETEKNEALFGCIERALHTLDQATTGFADLHLEFMVTLADELGFGPTANFDPDRPWFDLLDGSFVSMEPEHQYVIPDARKLHQLILKARGQGDAPALSRVERNHLIDQLVLFYQLHIDNLKEIQSHHVLREIL
ncbi:MAG: DNA repair protein RecO C-terminal domain-containing protein, partial [Saprospiraceae bacterium]|nr:DNA repair protein RecO C-terminal domain-containing protein [Saprospiraceae bacterium]